MASCRSCGAELVWAVTANGKRIPLDTKPVEHPKSGLFRLVSAGIDPRIRPPLAASADADDLYVSHFATCPNAEEWRKT